MPMLNEEDMRPRDRLEEKLKAAQIGLGRGADQMSVLDQIDAEHERIDELTGTIINRLNRLTGPYPPTGAESAVEISGRMGGLLERMRRTRMALEYISNSVHGL